MLLKDLNQKFRGTKIATVLTMLIIINIFIILLSISSQASPLIANNYISTHRETLHGYYGPNEFNPEYQKMNYEKLQGHVGLSVGTERGFLHASYAPISHLVLFDVDPIVTAYNKFNIALLKVSNTREDFQKLKSEGKYAEFVMLDKYIEDGDPVKGALRSYTVFEMIQALKYHHSGYEALVYGKKRRKVLGTSFGKDRTKSGHRYQYFSVKSDDLFTHSNYHFDDEMFYKLKIMATRNNIEAHTLPLSDISFFEKLAETMQHRGLQLSYLDLSNAWQSGYSTSEQILNVLTSLDKVTHANSRFILTDWSRVSAFKNKLHWKYFYLNPQQAKNIFKNNLSRKIAQMGLLRVLGPLPIFNPPKKCIEFLK